MVCGSGVVRATAWTRFSVMNIPLKPGKYVVAVSGGVDSIVLLDVLKGLPAVELIVAHYDHGIRTNSEQDRRFVQDIAARHQLPFVYENGELGPDASEAVGRQARYMFFERTRKAHEAVAVITAHHQDDVLETAILNLMRGTGRKGLTALASRPLVVRPILHVSKKDILSHADTHGLSWHEDSTNANEQYLRNYIRHRLLPRFNAKARARLLHIIERMRAVNDELDSQLVAMVRQQTAQPLSRTWFTQLPHNLAKEFLASWLRVNGLTNFNTKTLERVVVAAKTGRPGSRIDLVNGVSLAVRKRELALVKYER
jgi:tRNA(Ile)-lysidine synthase